jgi:hypothetical protein
MTAVINDKGRVSVHLFTPRTLKSANIKRSAERGYPNLLKKRVTRAIVPRKRINALGDSEDSMEDPFSGCFALFWEKGFKTKVPDSIMRSIPRNRGNIPLPGIRKVPMGIFRERTAVIPPKMKITNPTMISSLFIPPPSYWWFSG